MTFTVQNYIYAHHT